MLISQYGSTGKEGDDSVQQLIADAFVENFDNPNNITDTFHDDAKAKAWINKLNEAQTHMPTAPTLQ